MKPCLKLLPFFIYLDTRGLDDASDPSVTALAANRCSLCGVGKNGIHISGYHSATSAFNDA